MMISEYRTFYLYPQLKGNHHNQKSGRGGSCCRCCDDDVPPLCWLTPVMATEMVTVATMW